MMSTVVVTARIAARIAGLHDHWSGGSGDHLRGMVSMAMVTVVAMVAAVCRDDEYPAVLYGLAIVCT